MSVTLYEMRGTYDPAKLNLDKSDPKAWSIFAEKTRSIISKCLGIPKTNERYRDTKGYDTEYKLQLKKIIEGQNDNGKKEKEIWLCMN